jgi:RNA polymerase sigma factor (sigma-70 family)
MAIADIRALSDEDLIALVDNGEARAFEAIFDRHAGAAFSLAYRICQRRAIAEQVVQEAFLSLWRGAASYREARGSVRSWVLTVVHGRAIEALRRTVGSDSRTGAEDRVAERMPAPALTELVAIANGSCPTGVLASSRPGLASSRDAVFESLTPASGKGWILISHERQGLDP